MWINLPAWSPSPTEVVLDDIEHERERQDGKWGEQNHPNGTGGPVAIEHADYIRRQTDKAAEAGRLTWKDILDEETAEAFAEDDPVKLREELVQVAAVAASWVEALDRRQHEESEGRKVPERSQAERTMDV